jgi:hypothetical protein
VNYDAASVEETCSLLEKAGQTPRVMIDCSHANSGKDYTRQASVCRNIAGQIAAGDRRIVGVMLESNLVAGAQKLIPWPGAGLRAKHHRRLHRLGRNAAAARRVGGGGASGPDPGRAERTTGRRREIAPAARLKTTPVESLIKSVLKGHGLEPCRNMAQDERGFSR